MASFAAPSSMPHQQWPIRDEDEQNMKLFERFLPAPVPIGPCLLFAGDRGWVDQTEHGLVIPGLSLRELLRNLPGVHAKLSRL
jgi:hypothetical protein